MTSVVRISKTEKSEVAYTLIWYIYTSLYLFAALNLPELRVYAVLSYHFTVTPSLHYKDFFLYCSGKPTPLAA